MTNSGSGARSGARSRALAAVLAGTLACGSATDPIANLDTVAYASAVFALNGTPAGAATAINTPTAATVRTDIGYAFDVAFDLDATGRPVILTQRMVGNPVGSTGHQVSLQAVSGAFGTLAEAPRDGWSVDSILTVNVGQVVAVRAGASACAFFISPYMYSKMVVDSVNVSQRRLWLSLVTDPNCGFRSFATGRPTH